MKNQSVSDFVAATMDAVLNSKEHKDLFATQYKKAKDSMCAKHGKMDSCAADDQEAKSKKSSDSSSADDDNDARKHKKSDDDKDSCMADDQDAKKSSSSSSSDSSSADDDNDARKHKKSSDEDDSSYADDDNDARKHKDSSSDSSSADDDNDAKGGKKCAECGKPKNFCKCDKGSADDQGDWDTSKGAGQKLNYDRDGNHYKGLSGHGVGANKADDQNNANTLSSSNSNKYPPSFEGPPKVTSAAYDVAIDSLLTASAALDSLGLGRGSSLTLKIASLVVEAKKKDKKSKDSKKSDSQSAKDKKSKDSKKSDSHSAKDKKSDSKSSKDSHSAKDKKSDKKSDKKDDKKSSSSSKK